MAEKYNKTCERLWEKLEYNRDKLNTSCVDFARFSPYDQFCKGNPQTKDLVKQVESEYSYEMSEFQCSFAVNAFLRWDMADYNQKTGQALEVRR